MERFRLLHDVEKLLAAQVEPLVATATRWAQGREEAVKAWQAEAEATVMQWVKGRLKGALHRSMSSCTPPIG